MGTKPTLESVQEHSKKTSKRKTKKQTHTDKQRIKKRKKEKELHGLPELAEDGPKLVPHLLVLPQDLLRVKLAFPSRRLLKELVLLVEERAEQHVWRNRLLRVKGGPASRTRGGSRGSKFGDNGGGCC